MPRAGAQLPAPRHRSPPRRRQGADERDGLPVRGLPTRARGRSGAAAAAAGRCVPLHPRDSAPRGARAATATPGCRLRRVRPPRLRWALLLLLLLGQGRWGRRGRDGAAARGARLDGAPHRPDRRRSDGVRPSRRRLPAVVALQGAGRDTLAGGGVQRRGAHGRVVPVGQCGAALARREGARPLRPLRRPPPARSRLPLPHH
mmetsp:Transcript_19348/g.65249  ORF Transcript_19348/g.65249 Transcript_19348/m.65249 type:complete len:202 (+) Transcript_19348:266-871(+)